MGLLNWYFSDERKVKQALYDDEKIDSIWKGYFESFNHKNTIVQDLSTSDLRGLVKLIPLLQHEIIELESNDAKQLEIVEDLKNVSLSDRSKRLRRIKQSLDYGMTQHEYAHELVIHLADCLQNELHIVGRLSQESKHADELISHLKDQITLEEEIIQKIKAVPNFHSLFVSLARDEHLFRKLDEKKGSLRKRMWARMSGIFGGEITEGLTYQWLDETYRNLDEAIHKAHENFTLESIDFADYEFVNRPEFVQLVRNSIMKIRGKMPSDKLILVFANHFREWFIHCREETEQSH